MKFSTTSFPNIRNGNLLKALEKLRDNDYDIYFGGLGCLNRKYGTTEICFELIEKYKNFSSTGENDVLLDEFVDICLSNDTDKVQEDGKFRILIPIDDKEIVVDVDRENRRVLQWVLVSPKN